MAPAYFPALLGGVVPFVGGLILAAVVAFIVWIVCGEPSFEDESAEGGSSRIVLTDVDSSTPQLTAMPASSQRPSESARLLMSVPKPVAVGVVPEPQGKEPSAAYAPFALVGEYSLTHSGHSSFSRNYSTDAAEVISVTPTLPVVSILDEVETHSGPAPFHVCLATLPAALTTREIKLQVMQREANTPGPKKTSFFDSLRPDGKTHTMWKGEVPEGAVAVPSWDRMPPEMQRVWNWISLLQLRNLGNSDTPMFVPLEDVEEEEVMTLRDFLSFTFPTLTQYITEQHPDLGGDAVGYLCRAVEYKMPSDAASHVLAKLAMAMMTGERWTSFKSDPSEYRRALCDGSLLFAYPPVAFTAICFGAVPSANDACYFYQPPTDTTDRYRRVRKGDDAFLCALASLQLQQPHCEFYIVIFGLPKVLPLPSTEDGAISSVLCQWYAKLAVIETRRQCLITRFSDWFLSRELDEFTERYGVETGKATAAAERKMRSLP